MILVSGTIEIDPAHRDTAIRAALEMARATRQEEGCLSYDFWADLERPGVFRVFEEWRDQAALSLHFETPHMARFRESLAQVDVRGRNIKRQRFAFFLSVRYERAIAPAHISASCTRTSFRELANRISRTLLPICRRNDVLSIFRNSRSPEPSIIIFASASLSPSYVII